MKESVSFSLLLLFLVISGVRCQYDLNTLNLINATQTLHDLERYGFPNIVPNSVPKAVPSSVPYSVPTSAPTVPSLYPSLVDFKPNNQTNNTGNSIPNVVRPVNVTRPSIDKFINKTMSSIPSGICIKEVPTASLLKKNDVLVAGNGSDPSLSRIQVCCDGYQRSALVFRKCDPICGKGCGGNGICVAPETCTCYPDYVKNLEGICVKTCPAGCENGVCNPDNTCRCNAGYQADVTGKTCNPKCDRPCTNGFCSGPNRCSCKTGFAKDVIDPYRCVPSCSPPCENGICSGLNMCLCYSERL